MGFLSLMVACAGTMGHAQGLVTIQGIKSGTVAPGGLAFAALGLSSRRAELDEFFDSPDGSIVLGFGLGDANETIGMQVSANITSLTDAFGDSGNVAVKFSRRVAATGTPVFVGVSFDRLAAWGDGTLADPSASIAVTAFPRVSIGGQDYRLMMTAGYGSHVLDGLQEPGGFAGIGIGLTPNFGASLAWTGESVTLGTAFKFDGLDNFRFSASVNDLFDQVDGQRLTISASYYFDTGFGD